MKYLFIILAFSSCSKDIVRCDVFIKENENGNRENGFFDRSRKTEVPVEACEEIYSAGSRVK